MKKMTLDLKNISKFVSEKEFNDELAHAEKAFNVLNAKSGAGNDFLGWLDWPLTYDKEEFARIKKAAEKIRKQSQVLIVIGIGGSYLGARAAISMLEKAFGKDDLEIVFCGNNISSKYTYDLIEYIKDKDFSINVISKSGTTTEPAIAFRIFKKLCEERYGEGAKDRIFATTDKARGALKKLATEKGYETFVVPDDIGGRFSVTTAVGLLPIACAGIDIDLLMQGAKDAYYDFKDFSKDNDVVRYYSEFDRWVKKYFDGTIDELNKSILNLTDVKEDYQEYPNFSYLATFLPIVNFDEKLLASILKKEGIDTTTQKYAERLERAKHWVENYGSEYQVNLLENKNEEFYQTLSSAEKVWVKKTLDIVNTTYDSVDELQTALYAVVKTGNEDEATLKATQKRYFQIVYNLVLGENKGPKLGIFLMAAPKEALNKLLKF